MSGSATMNGWIAKLRTLAKDQPAEALEPVVREDLLRTINAGTTPDGVPWVQRKDGGRALAKAEAALTVVGVGRRILCVITGPTAIHHWGTKKDPRRQVLPTAIPATMLGKLKRAFFKRCKKILGVG